MYLVLLGSEDVVDQALVLVEDAYDEEGMKRTREEVANYMDGVSDGDDLEMMGTWEIEDGNRTAYYRIGVGRPYIG